MLKNLFRALSSKPSPLGSLTGVSLKIHSFRINSNSNRQQECVVGCWGKKSLYFSYTYYIFIDKILWLLGFASKSSEVGVEVEIQPGS